MDATNPVDILSAIKRDGALVQMAEIVTRPLTYEQAQATLTDALANVCECYGITTPVLATPSDVISFSLTACVEAGYYKALAFGHMARAGMFAASYVEEKDGYHNMQEHIFHAAQWAARGVSNNLARYVLLAVEVVESSL
jgi:hypothetical protein